MRSWPKLNNKTCEVSRLITTRTSMQRLSSNSTNNNNRCSNSNKLSFSSRCRAGRLRAARRLIRRVNLALSRTLRLVRPPILHQCPTLLVQHPLLLVNPEVSRFLSQQNQQLLLVYHLSQQVACSILSRMTSCASILRSITRSSYQLHKALAPLKATRALSIHNLITAR